MKNVFAILILSLTFASAKLAARTVQCSSADQLVSYFNSVPDTGVMPPHPLEATEILTFKKRTLVQKHVVDDVTGQSLPQLDLAKMEVLKTVNPGQELEETGGKAEVISHDLQSVVITRNDGKELYRGVIHCRMEMKLVP